MNTLRIVIEVDWKTVISITAAIILCMAIYSRFFYEEDNEKKP
jgi:hypothetical protein